MNRIRIGICSLLICFLMVGCSVSDKKASNHDAESNQGDTSTSSELFISAAASLTDAMEEVKEKYEQDHDINLTFNFAGSGKLSQQIQQGAPVDVFISANENWMDVLEEEELIAQETRSDITGNKLVLIVHNDSNLSYSSFKDIQKGDIDQIAIGNPESVPAGEYTQAVLEHLDYWNTLEGKFVFAKDVRQVLTYVESGNADIGFVYESDALTSDKVKVLAKANPEYHNPIIYPGAVTSDSKLREDGIEFLEFLRSEEGQRILKKYGFTNN